MGVAQLVERRSVAPDVAGSIPVSHPNWTFSLIWQPRIVLPFFVRVVKEHMASDALRRLKRSVFDNYSGVFPSPLFSASPVNESTRNPCAFCVTLKKLLAIVESHGVFWILAVCTDRWLGHDLHSLCGWGQFSPLLL